MAKETPFISYSCYHTRSWQGEQFIAEHVFSYQISGTLTMSDGISQFVFNEGSFKLSRRNQLVKYIKEPPPEGQYRSLSVILDQPTLRNFSLEYGHRSEKHHHSPPVISLNANPLFMGYVDSLKPYEHLHPQENKHLITLKQNEIILILLNINPELKDILFDFSEPGKIDLEAFMNKNFHFNVNLERFAYLTGRSLATFKRDFDKIFGGSPSKWLTQKRLQEAYYQIKEQGKNPSQVYLDLGFEDLSHFSFAFKKLYGVSPSRIALL